MGSFLEVIVASVEDSIEAAAGGADRLELLAAPECGGLTPRLDLVREVLRATGVPVRVMLRERASMCVSDTMELERMCNTARELSRTAIDGLVTGFVRSGAVDTDALFRICRSAPETPITFHRAFDVIEDPLVGVSTLKQFPNVDRVLTHGQGETLYERVASAERLQELADPEITIVFAAGRDAANLAHALRAGSRLEIHVGRAARLTGNSAGPVDRGKVSYLKQMLRVS